MALTAARRDLAAGTLLIALGAGIVLEARHYPLGTVSQMGPGYYPSLLGVAMALVGGLIILTRGGAGADGHDAASTTDWRGFACIVGSILAFLVLGAYAGFAPATFACVFIAALGDRTATFKGAAILALATTVLGMLLFGYALQLQLPMWRLG